MEAFQEFEFRAAEPAEYSDLTRVWRRSYGDAWPDDANEPLVHQEFFIGLWRGKPSFACSIFELPTYVRGSILKCAGVGAVGTVPEARSVGLASYCLDELTRMCHRRGYHMASLYGFRDDFYRRFGYASCGWRWQITSPASWMPDPHSDLPVREIDPADIFDLDPCFQQFAKTFNGSCARRPEHWHRRMGQKPPVIYAVGDPIEGYLWTNVSGFWNDLEIGEMGWSSRAGYEGLLALMRTLSFNKDQVIWNEPPNSPFLADYVDAKTVAKRHRHTMFRIIDVPGVLAATGGADLQIGIDDPVIESNRINPDSPRRVGVGRLTQVVMGDPGFGSLLTHDERRDDLAAIYPPAPVCCTEFF